MADDIKKYLDQNFQQFGQQIQQVQQELGGQIQQLREETTQQFREMGQRMDRIETEVREAHVLIEDLPDHVRLVAEGVDSLREQMERNNKELSRKIDEVKTFTRQAYKDLDARKLDKTA
jgi:methyl-accepting chemotaxis protein